MLPARDTETDRTTEDTLQHATTLPCPGLSSAVTGSQPIEQAFSKLKAHLRKIDARAFVDLINALGDVYPS
ncbi:hypothetical protein C9E81_16675 [Paracoccus alkanivorans]|uniref:Transposase n=1 Tax=Paracoccus alkanivorans TaxID=2116655 RepID=A0A3M0MRH2_9RHOB|nr:hypothetical protein C9E81_16675 [Paracoccus alkanivorans]